MGVGMCKDHKEKTQKNQISKTREIFILFGPPMVVCLYSRECNQQQFGFYRESGPKIKRTVRGGERRGQGPELLFCGVCLPPAGELRHAHLRRMGVTGLLAKVSPRTIGTDPIVWEG